MKPIAFLLILLLPFYCKGRYSYLITIPDSLTGYIADYVNDKSFDLEVTVLTYESIPDFMDGRSLSTETNKYFYVLLINAPVIYDTIPIPPYWGIMASDHFYGSRVGRITVKNGRELSNALEKSMAFLCYPKILFVGDILDDRTDGAEYKRHIAKSMPDYCQDTLFYNRLARTAVDKISANTLVNHMGHSNHYGFDHIATNVLPWFTNKGNTFIYSCGCYVGDYSQPDGVAMGGVADEHCWAAFIGGSVYQFFTIGAVSGSAYWLDSLFWDRFEHYGSISDCLYEAKKALRPTNPDSYRQWTLAETNILGDPTLPTIAGMDFQIQGTVAGANERDTITFYRDSNFYIRTVVVEGAYRIHNMDTGVWVVSISTPSKCTPKDALYVLLASVGLRTLTPQQKTLADVNGDGVVNATDALLISKHFVGLLPRFSVGEAVIFEPIRIKKLHTSVDIIVHFYGKLN